MKKIILPLCLLMGFASCYYDKKDELYPISPCDQSPVTYSQTIQPLLQQSCSMSGCHNTGTASGGVILDTYAGAQSAAASNRLMGAVKHQSGYSPMPKNAAPLDDCSIQKLQRWVDAGAPNN